MDCLKQARELAVEAALAAGKIQRERRNNVCLVGFKGEIDPVTETDLLCEKEIIGRISERFPDHAILAEESGEAPGDSAYKWVVDPLDGTVNYSHGFPFYCVSIGLTFQDEPVLGVVYNSNQDELFVAEKGKGATMNGQPISVSKTANLKQSLLVTGFAYDVAQSDDDNLDHFRNFIKASQGVRRPGSAAMDLVYTALGRFEGFWEMKLRPWDMAAGKLIVEEAGGRVTRFDGLPQSIYDNEILATNGLVHEAMVEVLRRSK